MPKTTDRGVRRGEGWIVERFTADGAPRFVARWREHTSTGVRTRNQTFSSRDAAEDKLRAVARSVRDGRYTPPSELTVKQAVNAWLERGAARWKPVTIATYRQRADKHVLKDLGTVRLTALTTARVQHWIDTLQARKLDPATIEGAVHVLTGAMGDAVRLKLIPSNPVRDTRRPPVAMKPITTWTTAEVRVVMAHLADDAKYLAVYRFVLATGVRPGELRGLQWRDVDLANARAIIRRTMTRDADNKPMLGASTKTGTVRAVALPEPVAAALKAWRNVQTARRLAAAVWHEDDFVFDRGDGRYLPAVEWSRRHQAIIAATGVRPITLHQLRHTNATTDLEAGTHPKIVQDRLGHKSITTTLDRYSHVSADLQKAAADALSERLFAPVDPGGDATTRDAKPG